MGRKFSTKNTAASVDTSAISLVHNTVQSTVSNCCLSGLPYSDVLKNSKAPTIKGQLFCDLVKHSYGDGLPRDLSRPSEFKLVAGGDSKQIHSSYGLALLSFWLVSPRLWNLALLFSYPLFSELHPALDIPGHSQAHNALLKADLVEIIQKRVRVNIIFCRIAE